MEYSELLENIKFNDYFHVLQLRRRGKLFFFAKLRRNSYALSKTLSWVSNKKSAKFPKALKFQYQQCLY